MFEALRENWHKANHPFEGFLGEVWELWKKDVGRATLLARQSWQDIPESVVQQYAVIDAQAHAAASWNAINNVVGHQLGAMGIFGGSGGGIGGPMLNPDQALFLGTLANIRTHKGDPPEMPDMGQMAAAVLTGQVDALQALVACTPVVSRQQVIYTLQAAQMMGSPQLIQLLRLVTVIQAAVSLPRQQIAEFLPQAAAAPGRGV
jgi:hypothetical protein